MGHLRTPRVEQVPKSVPPALGRRSLRCLRSGSTQSSSHRHLDSAFVVRRGVPLAHPDGERLILDLVGVVQCLAFREALAARPDVRAGILTVSVLVTDDLQALVVAEVDMLQ